MFRKLISTLEKLADRWDRVFSDSVIRFSYVMGGFHVFSPVEAIRKTHAEWFKKHVEKAKTTPNGKAGFVRCPGMYDYYQEGYLVVAHTDIHIKANSVGVTVMTPLIGEPHLQPQAMDFSIIDGMAPIQDKVARMVFKVPMPFGIFTEPGHSAHVLPALMHSPFLDKLFVYPGTVDYDDFHVCNFIFTPIKECEFVIPAGTPLLQVLPFKRASYHGQAGHGKQFESDQLKYGFPSRIAAFYRRKFHKPKKYTSEVKKT